MADRYVNISLNWDILRLYASWLKKGLLAINSLKPGGAIWCHRSWSTLVQVMACCLMAPSHHLNQCWLIIKGFCGIYLWSVSQVVIKILIPKQSSKIILWKLAANAPRANELIFVMFPQSWYGDIYMGKSNGSLNPTDTFLHKWTGSSLVKLMVCHLLKFQTKYIQFHSWNCIWKCLLWNGSHFFRHHWIKWRIL